MAEETMCHCGKPLHYSDPAIKALVDELIAEKGEYVTVTTGGRSWRVSRHYIALHGLKAWEVGALGFPEVSGAPLGPGDVVEKINSEPLDTHRDGARGKIVSVVAQMPKDSDLHPGEWGYMIEWEDLPGVHVFVMGVRIRPVSGKASP